MNGDRNDDKEDTVNNERNDEKEETVTGKSNVENSKTEVVVISTGKAVRREHNLPFFQFFQAPQ